MLGPVIGDRMSTPVSEYDADAGRSLGTPPGEPLPEVIGYRLTRVIGHSARPLDLLDARLDRNMRAIAPDRHGLSHS